MNVCEYVFGKKYAGEFADWKRSPIYWALFTSDEFSVYVHSCATKKGIEVTVVDGLSTTGHGQSTVHRLGK